MQSESVSASGLSVDVLGVRIDATSYAAATEQVLRWATRGESRYVCCANVHVVMEAQDSRDYARALEGASMVTPDGMPLVWFARGLGLPQQRVYGPTLMLRVCEAAARQGVPIGLYGGKPETSAKLERNLTARYPQLKIVYRHVPPFRALRAEEEARLHEEVERAGVRILFVGLGCPKQEQWMAAHAGRLRVVMLGVGAAFDFHAGTVTQAPTWMQERGLEWLFRLSREPRRLAGRYLRHNPRFVARALPALLAARLSRVGTGQ